MHIESKFEEIENIINDEYVRDKVTGLKNISIDMLYWLIEIRIQIDNGLLTCHLPELVTMVDDIIENATCESVEEVIN